MASEGKKIIELKDRTKIKVSRANIKCTNPTAKAVEIAIAAAVSSGGKVFAIKAHEDWIYELAYELAEAQGITLVNEDWDYWCLIRDSEPINPPEAYEASDIQSNENYLLFIADEYRKGRSICIVQLNNCLHHICIMVDSLLIGNVLSKLIAI